MRLGLFVATFGGLLFIVALVVPIPYGPPILAGGLGPAPGSAPRCLHLAYDYEQDVLRLPSVIRLHSDTVRASSTGGPWFRAEAGQELGLRAQAEWRPAGTDSIDIAWHHSPVLRLPLRGEQRVGRMAPAGVAPLYVQLGARDHRIVARPTSCDGINLPAT